MSASRARQWLAICGIWACAAACSRDAAAPRGPVAPVVAASQPSTPPPAVEPPPPPTVEPSVEPPAAEPVVALPPCPTEPQRDARQKPDHVVSLVELSNEMTVVDLGSGSGYFLCRLSRVVGARGRVIATEVGKQLVQDLKKRVAREQLPNVEVVHAPGNDVGIAPGTADRILVVNVWHHLSDRRRYATRLARALAPGGKVVVVDFKPGNRPHGIMPQRVLDELRAGGIDGALVSEDLPDQYVIVGSVRATDTR